MTNEYFSNADGRLWIQLDGPGTALAFVNCTDIGDTEISRGDVSQVLCPNPLVAGEYLVAFTTQGEPGRPSIQFTVPRGKTSGILDQLATRCALLPSYILLATCASRDEFLPLGTEEDFAVRVARRGLLSNSGMANQGSARRGGEGATGALCSYTFSFEGIEQAFRPLPRQILAGAGVVFLSVAAYDVGACTGCGERLIAGGTLNDLYFSDDGALTWTASVASPFAAGQDISAVGGYPVGELYRVFCLRGTSVAATHAQLRYSDDEGATWAALVNIGSIDTEFVPTSQGFWIVNQNLMFVVTDTGGGAAGSIYRGTTDGTSWTLVGSVAAPLNAVHALNDKQVLVVGGTNSISYSSDAGTTWEAITGPAAEAANDALSCVMLSTNHWLVGYDDGNLWQTMDGGNTWEESVINLPLPGTTLLAVRSLRAMDEQCVFMGLEFSYGVDHYGSLARDIAGGTSNSWEHTVTTTATVFGTTCVWPCGYNNVYGVF